MGKFGLGGSASRERSSSNEWQDIAKALNRNTSGSRTATFGPEGQQTLASLQNFDFGKEPGVDYNTQQAGNNYGRLAGQNTANQPNPYVEDVIQKSNAEGDTTLNNNLAQVRSQGYRGGTGANMYGQGQVLQNYAQGKATGNANLRYGAYNDASGRDLTARLAGAGGQMGLGQQAQQAGQQAIQNKQQQYNLAAQLLAILRGENFQEDVAQDETAKMTGGRSGTTSKTGTSIGFNQT